VSESAPISDSGLTTNAVLPLRPTQKAWRQLLAALFSTIIPGAGQLFLGKRKKAVLLLVVLVLVAFGFWPLRLPGSFPGLILLFWLSLLLSLFAVCDVLFGWGEGSSLPKWWRLASVPLTYAGLNIICTSLLIGSGFRALEFASTAMEPTLFPHDKFIFDTKYYRVRPAARGELVVVQREGFATVKRISAVGGDTIRGEDQKIFLNGSVLKEALIQHTLPIGANPRLDTFGPIVVPPNEYFVLGDNRDVSLDSRMPDFGLVDRRWIVGKPLYVYRFFGKGQLWQKLY